MNQAEKSWVALVAATAFLSSSPAALAEERDTDWYGHPELPPVFEEQETPPLEELTRPPTGQHRVPGADGAPPTVAESEFPRLMSVLDLDEWRAKDEIRSLRELASEVFFGVPLVVPQLILEEFLPRGLAIGPSTFLYRNPKDSRSMPLVVFDQAIFHESEFLANAQAYGNAAAYNEILPQSQRQILRRSLMAGFRATYVLPSLSTDLIMETASEMGVWAYIVAPTAVGGLLYLKGIDQKFSINDVVKGRLQIASGRDWHSASGSPDGKPTLACEVKFADLPFALIVSLEMSERGMSPQFIGIGTSLAVVEDLIGRHESAGLRPGR